MGRVKAPRPRGYEPGGFRFPQGNWCSTDRVRGVLFANDLPATRPAAPRETRVVARLHVGHERRHGNQRGTPAVVSRRFFPLEVQ